MRSGSKTFNPNGIEIMNDRLLKLAVRAEELSSHTEFIAFTADLAAILAEFSCENPATSSFLSAATAWLEDTGEYSDAKALSWSAIAKLLMSSAYYE
jgi:hypothetical protein